MAREIWITDVAEVAVTEDCVRAVLVSGTDRLVLRMSRHTLLKGIGRGQAAIRNASEAEIFPLPRH